MTSYTLAFTLTGLPKTTNGHSRAHWRSLHKEATKWKRAVRFAINIVPDTPIKKAKLLLIRRSSSEPDFDGLVSSFKHVIDGLIKAGIIESDKMSVIGQPEYKWEKVSRGAGHIYIEVKDLMNL